MVKTKFFAKSKDGFLKKLFGVVVLSLALVALIGTELHVNAQDDIAGVTLDTYNYLGSSTPASLGENGFWRETESVGVVSVIKQTYDTNGNLTFYESVQPKTGSGVRWSFENEYDESGKLVKKKQYFSPKDSQSDGWLYVSEEGIVEFEYDIEGNLEKETWIDRDENLRYIYEYGENERPIKQTEYRIGETALSALREYDTNGNLISNTQYGIDGIGTVNSYEYVYDTNGKVIKQTSHSADGTAKVSEIERDVNGRIVKLTKKNSDGTVVSLYEYKYDKEGNEIEGQISAGENQGDRRTIVYEYDDTGKNVTQTITTYRVNGITYDTVVKWTWFGPVDERPISNNDKVTDKISALPDDGTITVDYSDNAEVSADIFTAIAGTNKDVTFTSEGISWEFSGSDIDASAAKKIDLSTTITMINKQDQNTASSIENLFGQERNALVLKFADNGKLPGKAKIRINADEALKQYLGTTGLEVFYWDNENNTLVPIASKVSIDDNDQIVFEINHCSYYVVKGRETTKEDKHIPEDVNKNVPEGYEMLFRLYNPNSGEHFYTKSKREGNSLIDRGWNYEGEGWTAPISGTPVYRLYNENAGDHHYTTSEREKNKLVAAGWKYEGIGWYSETAENGKPLYRLYNPNATGAGSHHYTTSTRERDSLIKQGWNDEDIAWYGLKK